MSLRAVFIVLMISIFASAGLTYSIQIYLKHHDIPDQPCSSNIKNGHFINKDQQPYSLNGVITWWPQSNRITLLGVKTSGEKKTPFNRKILLSHIEKYDGVIHGKINELIIDNGDQLLRNDTIFGDKDSFISLLFKRIDKNSWLMMVNDDWVMLCEYK